MERIFDVLVAKDVKLLTVHDPIVNVKIHVNFSGYPCHARLQVNAARSRTTAALRVHVSAY